MKETCLFCGSEDIYPYLSGVMDRLGIAPQGNDFFKCENCGSLRLVPLPSKETLAKCYPEEYQFHKESGGWLRKIWNRLEWRLFYQPVMHFSAKLIAQETKIFSGRILDIGCGNGLRLLQFAKSGYEAEGVDFANIQYARDVLGLTVWAADIEDSDLPLNRYHLIMAYWVLEHLLKPAEFVKKVRRSLISKGWAILEIPLADSWISLLFRGLWASIREAPRHIGIPTFKGMSILLEKNGFKNIKLKSASTLELAADVALTLWPRGNYFMTTGRWAWLKILDRIIVGLLTLLAYPLVALLKSFGVKQGMVIFLAQGIDSPSTNEKIR